MLYYTKKGIKTIKYESKKELKLSLDYRYRKILEAHKNNLILDGDLPYVLVNMEKHMEVNHYLKKTLSFTILAHRYIQTNHNKQVNHARFNYLLIKLTKLLKIKHSI